MTDLTKRLCPRCKSVLPKPERLMICGKRIRFAGVARQCVECGMWSVNPRRLVIVRPVPTMAALERAA